MLAAYTHQIDPIITGIGGVYLWWYGASYTLGFIAAFLWIRRAGPSIGIDQSQAYSLSIFLAAGVLLGGRVVEVVFYEWAYYGEHPWHIPAIWLGGMSTHGILLGATLGILLFCYRQDRNFLDVADLLAVAGAFIMGVGRLGNFIDGQIAGGVTNVWWAVKFPDLEGFRHPVVLYDGLKNILLVPLLLHIRSRNPARGVVFAHFILWYGFLRIFVDLFRDYRTDFLGLPPGQEFNVLMTVTGVILLIVLSRIKGNWDREELPSPAQPDPGRSPSPAQRIGLVLLVLLPLIIPSDWTQDVPARYGDRHPGLEHSWWYPEISTE